MRTIHRDIVGGYIFSKDGKLLLGKNHGGGVYEGSFVIPGGGIDAGETKLEALRREMIEETGIDIREARVTKLYALTGEHEKTLRGTGERVFVKMNFHNYRIDMPKNAADIIIKADDDWGDPQWFNITELDDLNLSPPTRQTLTSTGIIN